MAMGVLINILFYTSIFIVSYLVTQKILRKLQNLPPTPFPTIPILGHLHLLRDPNSLHRTLAGVSRKYGPVVSLQLGSRPALLVSSPSAAEDCLHHHDVIFANRPRVAGAKFMGYDQTTMLWAPYGPLWRNHRRIAATEILSPQRLHQLSGIRADEARRLIRRVTAASLGEDGGEGVPTVEVKPMLSELTNNVMMRMIAGKRFYGEGSEGDEEARRFRALVGELLDSGGATVPEDFFPVLEWLGVNVTERRFRPLFAKLDGFFQGLVDELRREMEGGDSESLERKNKNLIEVLLELQGKNCDPSYFTDDIIKGLVQILLVAGTETSSSTMEWALALLINQPQALHKARAEIDARVGRGRLVEEADLSHLPYLQCIVNETLRMYPAAPILPPHENSDECLVGGYRVPRGTMLMVNVWAMQNDPRLWDEPREFRPERFESLSGGGEHRLGFKFIPFGSGRRGCPGENLAMRVVGLTLGTLIQCFDWERVSEELVDMEEKFGVSMWKANPLKAKCRPRKDMIELISQL